MGYPEILIGVTLLQQLLNSPKKIFLASGQRYSWLRLPDGRIGSAASLQRTLTLEINFHRFLLRHRRLPLGFLRLPLGFLRLPLGFLDDLGVEVVCAFAAVRVRPLLSRVEYEPATSVKI